MRIIRSVLFYFCLNLGLVACSNDPQLTQPSATIPARNPATTESTPTLVPTPLSVGASLLRRLPKCEGIQVLEEPIKFIWPNIEERLIELEGTLWGYYSCEGLQVEVAAFYREQMPKPPYNMDETNWVKRSEGTVGVYYNAGSIAWIYLWVVPQPDNTLKSYVIVAQTNNSVDFQCRLDQPKKLIILLQENCNGATIDLS
jgi:hypothetical protein